VQNIEFYDIFRKLEAFRNKVNDLYAYDRGCCGLPEEDVRHPVSVYMKRLNEGLADLFLA
jgi:hypothetical protein